MKTLIAYGIGILWAAVVAMFYHINDFVWVVWLPLAFLTVVLGVVMMDFGEREC